jgi:hypothetical protein
MARAAKPVNSVFLRVMAIFGEGFIEAHHLKPISSLEEGVAVAYDIAADFAVLCSNRHRMIHRCSDPSNLKLFLDMIAANETLNQQSVAQAGDSDSPNDTLRNVRDTVRRTFRRWREAGGLRVVGVVKLLNSSHRVNTVFDLTHNTSCCRSQSRVLLWSRPGSWLLFRYMGSRFHNSVSPREWRPVASPRRQSMAKASGGHSRAF